MSETDIQILFSEETTCTSIGTEVTETEDEPF